MMEEIRRVRVEDVLRARDERAARQQEYLTRYHAPLISFTMNIAGDLKCNGQIIRAFETGRERINRALARKALPTLHYVQTISFTGCEALWAVQADAQELKKQMCLLEEEDALGRLFDMDVIDADGRHLSREKERACLICGGPVRACARSRAHDAAALFQATQKIILEHFAAEYTLYIAENAQRALLYEALTTPKPGLVDCADSGAHKDMNIFSFADSACALRRYFEDCVYLGKMSAGFDQLQHAGLLAEEKMLSSAQANTHKGAVFSLGILCYAAGSCGEGAAVSDILQKAAQIGTYYLNEMRISRRTLTGGEQQFALYGLTGARGEAASGFATVVQTALPALQKALHEGKPLPCAGREALIALISRVKDSNIIRRAGMAGQAWAQAQAQQVLQNGCSETDLSSLNARFIEKNISPGGSADLLAITYFLHFLTVQEDKTYHG